MDGQGVKEFTHAKIQGVGETLGTRFYAGGELSLALLSVGYIVGLRIASFIFLGGVVGFVILVPIYGLFNGFSDGSGVLTQIGVEDYKKVWEDGFVSLVLAQWSWVVSTLFGQCAKQSQRSLSKAFKKGNDGEAQLRTEMDLPLDKVMAFVGS